MTSSYVYASLCALPTRTSRAHQVTVTNDGPMVGFVRPIKGRPASLAITGDAIGPATNKDATIAAGHQPVRPATTLAASAVATTVTAAAPVAATALTATIAATAIASATLTATALASAAAEPSTAALATTHAATLT